MSHKTKSNDFLTILKNNKKILKNIKFGQYLYIHMKIILHDWIDHLNFENKKPIHSTKAICAMHDTIT
jgi:hypothetical protein